MIGLLLTEALIVILVGLVFIGRRRDTDGNH